MSDISKADFGLLREVVRRVHKQFPEYPDTTMTLYMDLEHCHTKGCPLDFERLINFNDGDFLHDIVGIRKNINRETGEIENCFLPRCSAR